MSMKLGPAGTELTIDSTWSYLFDEIQDKQTLRTVTGALGSYVNSPSFMRFEIPISHISSSDKAVINSWYNTNTILQFDEDDNVSNVKTVKLMGEFELFPSFASPYSFEQYTGMITIETVA